MNKQAFYKGMISEYNSYVNSNPRIADLLLKEALSRPATGGIFGTLGGGLLGALSGGVSGATLGTLLGAGIGAIEDKEDRLRGAGRGALKGMGYGGLAGAGLGGITGAGIGGLAGTGAGMAADASENIKDAFKGNKSIDLWAAIEEAADRTAKERAGKNGK